VETPWPGIPRIGQTPVVVQRLLQQHIGVEAPHPEGEEAETGSPLDQVQSGVVALTDVVWCPSAAAAVVAVRVAALAPARTQTPATVATKAHEGVAVVAVATEVAAGAAVAPRIPVRSTHVTLTRGATTAPVTVTGTPKITSALATSTTTWCVRTRRSSCVWVVVLPLLSGLTNPPTHPLLLSPALSCSLLLSPSPPSPLAPSPACLPPPSHRTMRVME
jgi:hypothetical protein